MNLQKTERATFLEAAYLLIDRHRGDAGARYQLGRCVSQYPVRNGNGDMASCNNAVYAGEGYADLDGEPFKAWYCAKCAEARLPALAGAGS